MHLSSKISRVLNRNYAIFHFNIASSVSLLGQKYIYPYSVFLVIKQATKILNVSWMTQIF